MSSQKLDNEVSNEEEVEIRQESMIILEIHKKKI